jgi:alpha-tubulin suppressor-like RCC1 family protein
LKIENIFNITSGYNHHLVINESGEIYGWGNNEFGQLGYSNFANQDCPVLIYKF